MKAQKDLHPILVMGKTIICYACGYRGVIEHDDVYGFRNTLKIEVICTEYTCTTKVSGTCPSCKTTTHFFGLYD